MTVLSYTTLLVLAIGWVSAQRVRSLAAEAKGEEEDVMNVCERVDPLCVDQGLVGDCWLIAAVSALAEFGEPIRRGFRAHMCR